MGMFDRLYDKDAVEWQTKAYHCELTSYHIGDDLPRPWPGVDSYQVEVLGGPGDDCHDAFATVLGDVLYAAGVERDTSLPLLNYSGHLVEEALSPHPPTTSPAADPEED